MNSAVGVVTTAPSRARCDRGVRRNAETPGEWTTKSKRRSSSTDGDCTLELVASAASRPARSRKPTFPLGHAVVEDDELGAAGTEHAARSTGPPARTEHRHPLTSKRRDTSDLRHAPMVHRRPQQSVDSWR